MEMKSILETDRLFLCYPSQTQIEQYYSDIVGSNMFDTIQWEGPSGPNDLAEYWAGNRAKDISDFGAELHVAIVEKKSGFYVGGAAYRPVAGNSQDADVGYALAPKFHGQGYATESVGALVDEAFRNRSAERVFANVFIGNQASRNVVEKLGFLYEGIRRRMVLKRGEWRDEWLLAITRPDWEGRGEGRSSRL